MKRCKDTFDLHLLCASGRRCVGASDAAADADALPVKLLVDAGHAERLRAGLQQTWSNNRFDGLPAKIKIRVCSG